MSENKIVGGDDRLKKSAGASAREDRSEADTIRIQTDGTSLTMEERMRMARSEWSQEVLPSPPPVPGWHFCWLSTTNASDPIYKRVQKGYEPVKASEIKGFAQYSVEQGEFEGCVACNEMILFKIPEEIYQDIMKYFHYEKPLEDEQMLRDNATNQLEGKDSNGRDLGQVDGFDSLARTVRTPHFA